MNKNNLLWNEFVFINIFIFLKKILIRDQLFPISLNEPKKKI